MSWCNKLTSTPTVGLAFKKHFRPSSSLITAMSPVLDPLAGRITDRFTLAKQDAFGVEFTTETGFHYGVDPGRVFVAFQHRAKLRQVSGAVPILEMMSKAEPYTEMLKEVSRRAIEAAELLIDPATRSLERIGVISTTLVSEEDAPPGIRRCIEYMSKPWGERVENYHYQVASIVSDKEDWYDKCIHLVTKPETEEGLVQLQFDFQRIFKDSKSFHSVTSLKPTVSSVEDAALDYLEQLGVGDMFDENGNVAGH